MTEPTLSPGDRVKDNRPGFKGTAFGRHGTVLMVDGDSAFVRWDRPSDGSWAAFIKRLERIQ